MSKRNTNTALPILFSLAVVLGMFVGYKIHSNMPMSKSFFSAGNKSAVNEVMQLIRQRYVDSINLDSAEEMAVDGLLSTLDPHSVFIPASKLREVNEDLEGRFEGIGIEFNIFNDTVHVLSVMEKGPAKRSGLQVGDKILKVNDSSAVGIKDSDQFKSWVKGPSQSTVRITILRGNETMEKQITRNSIPISSLDAHYMIDKESGYIRLNRFAVNTYSEFITALEELKKKGLKKLVLDLRDNGGGIMEEAVDIADEFISGDQLIVYTEGINSPKKQYKAKRQGQFEEGELIVLINENSASASEILAGALQEIDRANIVGRRSFGKGLVQEQFSLSNGSALRLTTARYYTPLGRSIQKSYKEGNNKYKMELLARMHGNNDENKDSAAATNKKIFKTPKGKVLFDGGGITPDIPVAIQASLLDTSMNSLFMNNLVGNFAYRYCMANKNTISAFGSAENYATSYRVEDAVISALIQFAAKENVNVKNLGQASRSFLKNRIKALMARIVWGESAYFMLLNSEDNTYQKGVSLLKN